MIFIRNLSYFFFKAIDSRTIIGYSTCPNYKVKEWTGK